MAEDSLAVSSMAGNSSDNDEAMTAPGSPPVDPAVDAEHQSDPTVDMVPDPHVDRHVVSSGAESLSGRATWSRGDGGAWTQHIQ